MGNVLEALEKMNNEDAGVTSSYSRPKPDKVLSEQQLYELIDNMEEDRLQALEKKIKMRRERIEFNRKQNAQKLADAQSPQLNGGW